MSAFDIQPIEVDESFSQAPDTWLMDQAQCHGLRYLLAHADDGVIWGRVDSDDLHTLHGIVTQSPQLRAVTLQQCRLFGPSGELLVWRDQTGWRARLATDSADSPTDRFDEDQLLWGTDVERSVDGFTLVRDGAQGMRHAVPIPVTKQQLEQRQLRLRVRHYIAYNEEDGEARVTLSRLVNLLPEAK